ncbi:hypothetical protein EYF80_058710 [Liparis tanakae]|uniref:Uncharacterized protein n=1 Tax=Liparis tanakae TaxID=230148 RepID=A0A4Z2EQM2_9TELE|nr:hypothetical protein EYF80_058710 [Liparis tanakae]
MVNVTSFLPNKDLRRRLEVLLGATELRPPGAQRCVAAESSRVSAGLF